MFRCSFNRGEKWSGILWLPMMAAGMLLCIIFLQGYLSAGASSLTGSQAALIPKAPLVPTGCWTIVASPNEGGTNHLYEVAASSSTDVWAVGGSYQPGGTVRTLSMHWNGSQWSIIPSPSVVAETTELYGVDVLSATDTWAVGHTNTSDGGSTFIIHWDGTQWTQIGSPTVFPSRLYAVSAIAANDVWAVGHSGLPSASRTLILHWNGTSWSIVPSPNVGASFLYGVKAISANDVWAVGQYQGGGSRTLTLHWDGVAWGVVPSPGAGVSVLEDVDAVSSNNVWAVGDYHEGSEPGQTLIMRWNGSVWSIIPSPNMGTHPNLLKGVAAISNADIWAVGWYSDGSYGRTLSMHWDGASWTIVPSANPELSSNSLNGADGTSASNVWAVGIDFDINESRPHRTLIERYTSTGCPVATPTPTPSPPPSTATPTPCTPGTYSDVPPGSTFHTFVTCLSGRDIVSGYSDCTFRPNNSVTRSQLAKMVSNAAGFNEPISGQTFEDVLPTNTFYEWIERLTTRGYMTGYVCGGPGEPCATGRPYFRPFANATRGQTAKIVANAAGFTEPPAAQTFQDVPSTSTFYEFIQRLASRNVMQGYNCGGPGEPCVGPENRPYFRPNNDVTRGQSAKIVANTFFPNCETPVRR